jgi:hypoxanthine phosphoribosyltransferase
VAIFKIASAAYKVFSLRVMPELIPVLSSIAIRQLVLNLAERISADYRGREPVLLGVLKGSFIFLADLIRQLSIAVKIDFVQASSYGDGTSSSEMIRLSKDVSLDLRGQDVVVVEDIVDTGLTIQWIVDHLWSFQPSSVCVCTLIDKRERRKVDVPIAYAGHVAAAGFLVGYGLDHAERYRYLPEIYDLKR